MIAAVTLIALTTLAHATPAPSAPSAPAAPAAPAPTPSTATTPAPARVAVVVRASGFTEGDTGRLRQKVDAEVAARGVEVVRLQDVDAACLTTRDCARELVRAASAVALVRVELIRAGGNVQLTAAIVDGEGRPGDDAVAIARVAAVLGDEPLLPAAVGAALEAALPKAAPEPTPTPAPTEGAAAAAAPLTPETAPESEPPAAAPLSGLALAAIGGITVGALAAAVGLVGATGQYAIARDAGAAGVDKERAAVLVPTLVVIGVAGVGLGAASGWLLAGELD